MSKRKSSWPIGGASASVTSCPGCPYCRPVTRRCDPGVLVNQWTGLPYESGYITTEGKRRMADLNWRYEQAADLHLMSEEFYQRNTPMWKKFTNWLRNLFTR